MKSVKLEILLDANGLPLQVTAVGYGDKGERRTVVTRSVEGLGLALDDALALAHSLIDGAGPRRLFGLDESPF
jgi:hypothetical protein